MGVRVGVGWERSGMTMPLLSFVLAFISFIWIPRTMYGALHLSLTHWGSVAW